MSKKLRQLICPRCHSDLTHICNLGLLDSITCFNPKCQLRDLPFLVSNGVPCLIDFERSIFNLEDVTGLTPQIPRMTWRRKFIRWLEELSVGSDMNGVTSINCKRFIHKIGTRLSRPVVLVIGGGTIGAGAFGLYTSTDISIIGTDVFFSPHVDVVCDAHSLPFATGSFDGVWIQAILEHVLEPSVVVSEIHRVLRNDGVVYAETPFMQQVHMGAYDFHRFTKSGHRWLFRNFSEIDSGVNGGPGLSLVWAVYFYLTALTRSIIWWLPLRIMIGWLTKTERFMASGLNSDDACCLFFMGQRSNNALEAKDIVKYYDVSILRD